MQQEDWSKVTNYIQGKRNTETGLVKGKSLISMQADIRPNSLQEDDSYKEMEHIYSSKCLGSEKDTIGLKSGKDLRLNSISGMSNAKPESGCGFLRPLSMISNINSNMYNPSAIHISPATTNHQMSQMTAGNFWQTVGNGDPNKEKAQPREREDLQKRIAAYYQSVRNAESYHEPTSPKNSTANLWAIKPVPKAFRTRNSSAPRPNTTQG